MAGITTHVLDSNRGRPAAGVRIDLSVKDGGDWKFVKTVATNADGRTDGPVVKPEDAKVGEYELVFHIDEYFQKQPDPSGMDQIGKHAPETPVNRLGRIDGLT